MWVYHIIYDNPNSSQSKPKCPTLGNVLSHGCRYGRALLSFTCEQSCKNIWAGRLNAVCIVLALPQPLHWPAYWPIYWPALWPTYWFTNRSQRHCDCSSCCSCPCCGDCYCCYWLQWQCFAECSQNTCKCQYTTLTHTLYTCTAVSSWITACFVYIFTVFTVYAWWWMCSVHVLAVCWPNLPLPYPAVYKWEYRHNRHGSYVTAEDVVYKHKLCPWHRGGQGRRPHLRFCS